MKHIAWLLFLIPALHAQVLGPGQVYYVTSAPSGACTEAAGIQIVYPTGGAYVCSNGTWSQIAGSGGSGVATFNGRSGTVVPASGDYTVGEVTGAAPTANPTFTGGVTTPALTIPTMTLDVAQYSNLNAAITAANTYATTNESGSGHAINLALHDATYSLSPAIAAQTITSVANASGGTSVYTGTFSSCSSGWTGLHFYVSGFVTNAINNGDYIESACTATTLTLSNGGGIAETASAQAVSPTFVNSGVSIVGVSPRMEANATNTPDRAGSSAVPNGGTWINCSGAPCFTGTNAIGNTLRDFGLTNWAGYAIVFGGNNVNGLLRGQIENLKMIGPATVTAGVNGIYCNNCQGVNSTGVFIVNVNNGFTQTNQNNFINSGNSQWDNIFISTYALSAANGNNTQCALTLSVLVPPSGTTKILNDVEFNFPQVNSFAGDATANEICINGLSGAVINSPVIQGSDFEGGNANTLYMTYTTNAAIDINQVSGMNTYDIDLGSGATDNVIKCDAWCIFNPATFTTSGNINFLSGFVRNWTTNLGTTDWGQGIAGCFSDIGGGNYCYQNQFLSPSGTGAVQVGNFLAQSGTNAQMIVGHDATNAYNSSVCQFNYSGTGSTSNSFQCGLFGQNPAWKFDGFGRFLVANLVSTGGTSWIPSTAGAYNGISTGGPQMSLMGTTGTITGTVLAGTCDSGTATVTGAVVGHPVAVSSTTGADVGGAFNLRASVTATSTVTVYVCGTGTPASLAYNVTVF